MKIAVVSDEFYPIHSFVLEWLKSRRHEPVLFGALKSKQEESWVQSAREAAQAIKEGICDEGVFFCWTGTGISIAANKLPGIRAALCGDAETARGARIWNHANILALSNRLLDQEIAKEILTAWFEDFDPEKGAKGVAELKDFEELLTRGSAQING
jgi:ribose 5-phosphate isomerase B